MGTMKRVGFLLCGLALCGAQSLAAHVQVLSAYYGARGRFVDVTERVQRIADRGYQRFRVENETFGCDPMGGEKKTLEVVYVSGGLRQTDRAREGDEFGFKRGGGWSAWSPWYQGQWPGVQYGGVSFRNGWGDKVFVYHVNPQGRWTFVDEVFDGEGFSRRCPMGETWIVTDRNNRILRQVRAGRGDDVVVVGREPWGDRPSGARVEIKFANRSDHEVWVFRVDQRGRWDKVAEIDEDEAEARDFYPGEPWLVTDKRNRLIASGRAGRESQRIEVRD